MTFGPLRLAIHWPMASFFGWGIYGLNLALAWSDGTKVELASTLGFEEPWGQLDALRRAALQPTIARSQQLRAEIVAHSRPGDAIALGIPALLGFGNHFEPCCLPLVDRVLAGERNLGVIFIEDTAIEGASLERLNGVRRLIAGSSWNREVLSAGTSLSVDLVLQGVDTSLFHPAPRLGLLGGRFAIFSGGKLEFRKGQDLVLRAFAAFRQRHPEAVLVTAWQGASGLAADVVATGPLVAPTIGANGQVAVHRWASDNGIPPESVIDLGVVPNHLMPPILREMDVAVFPNRAEGGTNLVAMECMATGVPTVLSDNTGHLDIIGEDICIALERQQPVGRAPGYRGTEGWGESDVDEIVEALESLWVDRKVAAEMGLRGAAAMATLSWAAQAERLREVAQNHFNH